MKKNWKVIALSALAIFTAGAATLGTFSWFYTESTVPNYYVNGNTSGAYFAYGTGTVDDPFGIRTPKHLSNLAWLQYNGYFSHTNFFNLNEEESADPNVPYPTVYFELDKNIDCSGWIIPPIGTVDNPFIGQFNGKGYVISNLTVSNQSSISTKPRVIAYNEQPEIVGLFGVVGSITENQTTYPTHTYNTSANQIVDTGIDGLTIISTTPKTLAGMAAGYVNANISNVVINDSTIDIQHASAACVDNKYTTNLSDYGVVGYAADAYKKSIKHVDQTMYDVNIVAPNEFNANDDGDAQGWGGSINMKTIYNRIVSLRKTKATNVTGSYQWRIDRTYYDGVEDVSSRATYTALTNDKTYDDAFSRYNGFNETGHEYLGSYNVYARQGENGYGSDNETYGDQQYLYLSGGHYENRHYYSYYTHEGYPITNGSYYLNINNNHDGITRGNALNGATRWVFSEGSSKIYTAYNNTNYYLYNNNGNLGITSNSGTATTWTITVKNNKFIIDCGNYYINYTNNNWVLSAVPGLYITDGTNYLTYNGSLTNTTNSGSASTWTYPTSGTGYIYTTYNNTTYYLRNNNGTLTTATNNNRTTWTVVNSNNKLDFYDGNYHITYENGWKLKQDSGSIYYLIHDDNNHYIGPYTGSGAATSTNEAGAAKLSYGLSSASNSNGQYGFYYTSSSTDRWFGFYSTGTYAVQVYNDSRALYHLVGDILPDANTPSVTGKIYATYSGTTYYVKYNGSNPAWTTDTNQNNGSNMTIEYHDTRTFSPVINVVQPSVNSVINQIETSTITGPDSHQTSADTTRSTNESHMYYTAEDTTYIPLNVGKDLDSYISNTSSMNTQISSGNLDPKDSNTGYIVSGSNTRGQMGTSTKLSSQDSDIRISRYAITNVNASFNKSSGSTSTISDLPDNTIYTINTSGTETNMSQVNYAASNSLYPRYKDSKTTFYSNSLTTYSNSEYKTNAYIYGLHFMNSTISDQALVNASKVSVLGYKSDTYQFPVDCIDFNLKQKGVINFFAGTYFDENNSFFSLHQIIRNNDAVGLNEENKTYTSFNTINQIKEISEIYASSYDVGTKTSKYSIIYKYSDGTYSEPYRVDGNQNKYVMNKANTDDNNTPYTANYSMSQSDFNSYVSTFGYSLRFKTSQIGKRNSAFTSNRIYYFEFPMNDGEYCLGSVNGGTGAYLLYLDIGANAAKTQRTIAYEHYQIIEKMFTYPNGVAVNATTIVATNVSSKTALDETDTSNFVIYAGYQGKVSVSRDGNDVEFDRTGGITSAKPTLVGDNMWDDTYQQYNIHNPSGDNLTSEIVSVNTTTDIRRLQYWDYNVNLDELMVTIITDISTDGGTTYERSFYQEYANGESTEELEEMKIYNTSNGIKYDPEDLEDPSTSTVKTYKIVDGNPSINTNVILTIEYVEEDGVNAELDWLLELVVDNSIEGGRYYKYGDYVFTAEIESGSLKIVVLSVGSRTIKINSVTITGAGTYTVTPPDTVTPPTP